MKSENLNSDLQTHLLQEIEAYKKEIESCKQKIKELERKGCVSKEAEKELIHLNLFLGLTERCQEQKEQSRKESDEFFKSLKEVISKD